MRTLHGSARAVMTQHLRLRGLHGRNVLRRPEVRDEDAGRAGSSWGRAGEAGPPAPASGAWLVILGSAFTPVWRFPRGKGPSEFPSLTRTAVTGIRATLLRPDHPLTDHIC